MIKKLSFFALVVFLASCGSNGETDKVVTIKTNFGDMKVILYDETPAHKANFIALAEEGKYDSTIFHRVMQGFMVQGGDMYIDNPTAEPEGDRLEAEIVEGLFHKKGELAAARQPDQVNPTKKSSSCQFYIVQGRQYSENELTTNMNKLFPLFYQHLQKPENDSLLRVCRNLDSLRLTDELTKVVMDHKGLMEETSGQNLSTDMTPEKVEAYSTAGGTPFLDGEYTVFGRVVEGLEVVDKIAAVQVAPGNRPLENVYMFTEVSEMSKSEITEKYDYTYPEK